MPAAGRHPRVPGRAGRGRVASWASIFQHRFTRGELAGHSLGNLFLAALTEVAGSFDAAVALTSRALAIAGEVCRRRAHPAALVAEMEDGRVVAGETAVAIRPQRRAPAPARPPRRRPRTRTRSRRSSVPT